MVRWSLGVIAKLSLARKMQIKMQMIMHMIMHMMMHTVMQQFRQIDNIHLSQSLTENWKPYTVCKIIKIMLHTMYKSEYHWVHHISSGIANYAKLFSFQVLTHCNTFIHTIKQHIQKYLKLQKHKSRSKITKTKDKNKFNYLYKIFCRFHIGI